MYNFSQDEISRHFNAVQNEIEYRWNALAKDIDFPFYSPGRQESSIIHEFECLNNIRSQMLLDVFFNPPKDLILSGRFRRKSCLTFEHSSTDLAYNCSTLKIGKRRFFALEGPMEDSVPYFLNLLKNWKVSYLACLTDQADSEGNSLCYPYWKGRVTQKEGIPFLRLNVTSESSQDVSYLFWPEWMDSQGVDPRTLIEAANPIRYAAAEEDIVAVHCSAGVGRTGTFISAICLLDAVDEQLAKGISPDQIQIKVGQLFLYLNFHRPWMVATPSQYITLYRTVELYFTNNR